MARKLTSKINEILHLYDAHNDTDLHLSCIVGGWPGTGSCGSTRYFGLPTIRPKAMWAGI
jgi:hypothetical protein